MLQDRSKKFTTLLVYRSLEFRGAHPEGPPATPHWRLPGIEEEEELWAGEL
jgi:hypothetical protein